MYKLSEEYWGQIDKVLAHKSEGRYIIHACLSGSYAYGTSGPNSDLDIRGVYVAKPAEFLQFTDPALEFELPEIGKDIKFFELKKFLSLCAKGNPHQLEILFSDNMMDYTWVWEEVQQMGNLLLNKTGIYEAYRGYAKGEFKALEANPEHPRYLKRFAHILRLLVQGSELLERSEFNVRLSDKQAENIADVLSGKIANKTLNYIYEVRMEILDSSFANSTLPSETNWNEIARRMNDIRNMCWQ